MFTVEYVKDMKWENEAHTYFSCVVKYAQFGEEVPAGINGIDPTQHIREIWEKGNAGEYGLIAEYVYVEPPIPNAKPDQEPTVEGAQTL